MRTLIRKRLFLLLVAFIATAAVIIKKTSEFPAVTTPGTNDIFLLESGVTNKYITYSNLKSSINASNQPASANLTNWAAIVTNAMVNGTGSANTLAIWSGTNLLAYVINGVGILTNDGSGGFGFSTNLTQDVTVNNITALTLSVSNIITTNITTTTINSTTNIFNVAKGGHLTISSNLTVLQVGPSKIVRTDSSTNLAATTIGTGLVFDGTTLYPTNLVDAQINSLAGSSRQPRQGLS